MVVLGIETSCDETGVAIYCSERGLIANQLYSQVDMHAEYGGVVPELASRDHLRRLPVLIDAALAEANIVKEDITGVAYTAGPGLMGALLVGATFARSYALALQVPAVGVHHLEAHLMAPMLENNPPCFPFLALLVSGGHTLIASVNRFGSYEILGQSLDDAAGEAFDKTAKLMNLGYPGGPAVAALAATGDGSAYKFPRPMTDRPGLDMSFSGLKTFVRNTIAKADVAEYPNIAAAFQTAVVDTLLIKCRRAIEQTGFDTIVIAGGVSANIELRDKFAAFSQKRGLTVAYPRLDLCTDNGAMVAYTGWRRLQQKESSPLALDVRARWPISELN